jgi:hypothetical protein
LRGRSDRFDLVCHDLIHGFRDRNPVIRREHMPPCTTSTKLETIMPLVNTFLRVIFKFEKMWISDVRICIYCLVQWVE